MKCKIDDLEYTIEEQGTGKYVYLNDFDESRLGICMMGKQRIMIHEDLSEAMKKLVLRHELCHAFMFTRGFNDEQMSEEQVCDLMACVSPKIVDICEAYFNQRKG